jgi:hypothetical protein
VADKQRRRPARDASVSPTMWAEIVLSNKRQLADGDSATLEDAKQEAEAACELPSSVNAAVIPVVSSLVSNSASASARHKALQTDDIHL